MSLLQRTANSLSKVCTNAARLSTKAQGPCRFGLILDADGVIMRGRELLPGSREALLTLTDVDGNFKVPTVFLTNAGNTMRATKAARLSELTGIHIKPTQVVMAHSPLRMFTHLHDKPVLVSGQGPVRDIAFALGFRDVTSVSDLQTFLPQLDVIDSKRRMIERFKLIEHGFKPIEAVLLLGEPLKWESSLQLITDVLLTNGLKDFNPASHPSQHIPVFACNLDLFWLGEKNLPHPRFGHGMFLECLEKVYKRMTCNELYYRAILGKPSEVTYLRAAHCIEKQAVEMGLPPVRKVFAIGDNTESDILGANLFEQHLQTGEKGRFDNLDLAKINRDYHHRRGIRSELKHCFSVLIESGVYAEIAKKDHIERSGAPVHGRLTQWELAEFRVPAFVEKDLSGALGMICDREKFAF